MPEFPVSRRGRKLKNLFQKLMHANTDRARLNLDRLPTNICHYYHYITLVYSASTLLEVLFVIRTIHKLRITVYVSYIELVSNCAEIIKTATFVSVTFSIMFTR
jgi:hypothetical protein